MHEREQPERRIRPTSWEHFDPGGTVLTADGEELGVVRELLPHYLEVRSPESLAIDVELYVPRDLVARVERGRVHLRMTKADLAALDLATPPAQR